EALHRLVLRRAEVEMRPPDDAAERSAGLWHLRASRLVEVARADQLAQPIDRVAVSHEQVVALLRRIVDGEREDVARPRTHLTGLVERVDEDLGVSVTH